MVDMDFGFVFYEWILVFDFFFWKMNVSRQTNAYDLVMPAWMVLVQIKEKDVCWCQFWCD